jgi:uncharacterized protein (TIGR00290 family)
MEKTIINWSGGKDSALCLKYIIDSEEYDPICLLTTISKPYQRISMHGVRTELLEAQAESIGLPLVKVEMPENPSMGDYENLMVHNLSVLKKEGATVSAFGDIFLEDVRQYREQNLKKISLKPAFPLWGKSTSRLVREFIDMGFRTIVTCVDEKYLDRSFAGRVIDHDFLKDLPAGVDPCGENGEFHTFVFDAPVFKNPVELKKGEVVYRQYPAVGEDVDNKERLSAGFWFCDLVPC